MKAKSIVTALLLIFVIASLGYLVLGSVAPALVNDSDGPTISEGSENNLANPRQVVAYYFHATKRCPTCLEIEALAKEAIAKNFAGELENGRLKWEMINYEDYGNEHYVNDYQLIYSSLIISEYENGKEVRWKNLEKVWDLVWESEDFILYVKSEIGLSLGSDEEAPAESSL